MWINAIVMIFKIIVASVYFSPLMNKPDLVFLTEIKMVQTQLKC